MVPTVMADPVAVLDLDEAKGPFFRVLHTTERSQTAVMTIPPDTEAGPPEVHAGSDQVFHVVTGRMRWRTWPADSDAPVESEGGPGTVLVVPAGVCHWVKSVGPEPLFFLTVYSPPEY